jgi:hypothetical protein
MGNYGVVAAYCNKQRGMPRDVEPLGDGPNRMTK